MSRAAQASVKLIDYLLDVPWLSDFAFICKEPGQIDKRNDLFQLEFTILALIPGFILVPALLEAVVSL